MRYVYCMNNATTNTGENEMSVKTTTNTSKRDFYAWVGQKASTGTPNQVTGRMSMYGTNHKFLTRKERDKFVADFYSNNPSEYAVACTKRQLRSFNLGTSVADFETDLDYMDYTTSD